MKPGYIFITIEQASRMGLLKDCVLLLGGFEHHARTGYAWADRRSRA